MAAQCGRTADNRRRAPDDSRQRALLLWPGLDRMKLARTRGEPQRVARLVACRTALPHETILGMLGCEPESHTHEREQESPPPAGITRAPGTTSRHPVFSAADQR